MPVTPKYEQVNTVLRITLVLNLLVAVGKIVTGILTGAIAITADGIHSLIDALSNVLALFANRIAAQPADDDHPYGHRRFETVAALALGILLLLTAWEIITSAVDRLFGGEAPQLTAAAFGVMGVTLGVNIFVSRYERRKGQELNSELLIADAANTGADVWVTVSVLVSMVLVTMGVGWADAAAAVVVVVLIGRAAWGVIRGAGGVLVDTAPYTPAQLTAIAESVPSVQQVVRVRSRGTQDAAFIDIDIAVEPATTTDHTAAIADAVRTAFADTLTGVDEIEIHFVPTKAPDDAANPNYALIARAAADALGMSVHEVRMIDRPTVPDTLWVIGTGKLLEMHVEVAPGQTLNEAHDQVTTLEVQLREQLPEINEIITHIEPMGTGQINGLLAQACIRLQKEAKTLLDREYPLLNWHDLRAVPLDNGCALTLHVTLPGTLTLERAHQIAESAEAMLRSTLPRLTRVTIHTEPIEAP